VDVATALVGCAARERGGDIRPSAVIRRGNTTCGRRARVARPRETRTPVPSDVAREPSAASASRERAVRSWARVDGGPADVGPVAVNRGLVAGGPVSHPGSTGTCHVRAVTSPVNAVQKREPSPRDDDGRATQRGMSDFVRVSVRTPLGGVFEHTTRWAGRVCRQGLIFGCS
jgi:hypothetical protein